MLTSKLVEEKVQTHELQRGKKAKKNHGRQNLCCVSLLYSHTYTDNGINPNPTPVRIKTRGNKPVLSIREFQITFFWKYSYIVDGICTPINSKYSYTRRF